jgi:hypothetical protein
MPEMSKRNKMKAPGSCFIIPIQNQNVVKQHFMHEVAYRVQHTPISTLTFF